MRRRRVGSKKKKVRTQKPATAGRRMLYRQIAVGIVLASAIALIMTGLWHGSRIENLTIASVTASGGVTIPTKIVVGTVEEELIGSYYRLIPKRFTYTYPEDAIRMRLHAIERIRDVTITKPDRTTLHVEYEEYEPRALWCNDVSTATNCVFIDDTGYGFTTAPELTGGTFIRYRNMAQQPKVGEIGVPAEVLQQTRVVAETMADEFNWRTNSVAFDDRDITYVLGGGAEIVTTLQADIRTVLENLDTILQSDNFSHLTPTNFEYIDLRYDNKVFVQEVQLYVATTSAEFEE